MKTLNIFNKLNVIIYALNVLIIVFLFLVMSYALRSDAFFLSATDTLNKLPRIPAFLPQESFTYSMILIVLLIASQVWKYSAKSNLLISGLIIVDIIICILLQRFMYINYRGIFYIVLLNILFFQKGRERFWLLVSFSSVFVLMDFYGNAQASLLTSFDTYVSFFTRMQRIWIYILKFTLFTGLDVLFFCQIFLLFSAYTREKDLALSMYQELVQSNKELTLAYSQLKEYADEIEQQTVQNERTRLAMEIHDTVGHSLTAVVMGLEACSQLLKKKPDTSGELLRSKMLKMKKIAGDSLVDIRRSVDSLRPAALEKSDIISSLWKMFDNLNNTGMIQIAFQPSGNGKLINEETAFHIYRIIQEAVTNSIKNGRAKNILVQFGIYHNIQLHIEDDGVGCEKIAEGQGLFGIRKRIDTMKGRVSFFSAPNRGFSIDIELPL